MRRAARTDANQQVIVNLLRFVGASVAITSGSSDGFPDLVVGFHDRNVLMEIKDGEKPPSARKLTTDEQWFVDHWTGDPVRVVESETQALEALGFTPADARETYASFLRSLSRKRVIAREEA